MKRTNLFKKVCPYLTFLLLGVFTNTIKAQVIQMTSNDNGVYSFGIIGQDGNQLGNQDLVYYRFSDGHHISAIQTSENPNASVMRTFKIGGNQKVIAYIARKNGPLEMAASSGFEVVACSICSNPVVSFAPTDIVHMSTSWSPFTNGNAVSESFDDNISDPQFITPLEPWFFLNVTVQNEMNVEDLDYIRLSIPVNEIDVLGVVISNTWIDFTNISNTNIPVSGSPFCNYINNNTSEGYLEIGFNSEFIEQGNFYFLMKSSNSNPNPYLFFETQTHNKDKRMIERIRYPIQYSLTPHDPNHINGESIIECDLSSPLDETTFRIDFQNIGIGSAKNVIIKFKIDENVLIADSYLFIETKAAHLDNMLEPIITNDLITITFENIYLPGTQQIYPYVFEQEQTKGWIEFKLNLDPCVTAEEAVFLTTGEIIFQAEIQEDGPLWEETTPLNTLKQIYKICVPNPFCD